jgi:hypothetical protein
MILDALSIYNLVAKRLLSKLHILFKARIVNLEFYKQPELIPFFVNMHMCVSAPLGAFQGFD